MSDIEATPVKVSASRSLAFEDEVTKRKMSSSSSSSLRKWGPAMLAILAVLGLNAYLLGPTGARMPAEASARAQRRNMLAEELTNKIQAMDAKKEDFSMNLRNPGSYRYLSEEDGGTMEYTRRRHRALNEYVHVDVSDQFSTFGKVTVTLIYFAFWVFLMVSSRLALLNQVEIWMKGLSRWCTHNFILFFDAYFESSLTGSFPLVVLVLLLVVVLVWLSIDLSLPRREMGQSFMQRKLLLWNLSFCFLASC